MHLMETHCITIDDVEVDFLNNNRNDKYGNPTFCIAIPYHEKISHNEKYDFGEISGVKLPSRKHWVSRYRIFIQPNACMNIRYEEPDNPTWESKMTIGNYSVTWGDGEPIHAEGPDPDLVEKLYSIHETNKTLLEVIGTVLLHVGTDKKEWV